MQLWEHIRTSDNLPIPRGDRRSAREEYSDGFDPNVDRPFGTDRDTRFVPVIEEPVPTYDRVNEKITRDETMGADGELYQGVYVAAYSGSAGEAYADGNWVDSYTVSPQTDLDRAKSAKLDELRRDVELLIEAGYSLTIASGTYTLELSEAYKQQMLAKVQELQLMIDEGEVPAGRQLSLADRNGAEYTLNSTQWQNRTAQYCKTFTVDIEQRAINAQDRILAATTIAEVDAISWDNLGVATTGGNR